MTTHALGAGMAVRHLAGLGHHRIGLVVSKTSPTSPAIRAGWTSTMAELGRDTAETLNVDVPRYGSDGWEPAYDALLQRCVDEDTHALLVHSDREAIGIIQLAHDRGIVIPDDVAVVSYDDEMGTASDPPLTAVCPPKRHLGALAAELALARVSQPVGRPIHRIELWPTLVVRQSCGGVPTAR